MITRLRSNRRAAEARPRDLQRSTLSSYGAVLGQEWSRQVPASTALARRSQHCPARQAHALWVPGNIPRTLLPRQAKPTVQQGTVCSRRADIRPELPAPVARGKAEAEPELSGPGRRATGPGAPTRARFRSTNKWRRGRDSNPRRRGYPRNSFQDCRIQPLCHPSGYRRRTKASPSDTRQPRPNPQPRMRQAALSPSHHAPPSARALWTAASTDSA